ncbi:MAG: hypothetical protein HS120_02495 [Burkholderiales bacterium]|nr:hypothetical protein [Burkholderiales bacterium]
MQSRPGSVSMGFRIPVARFLPADSSIQHQKPIAWNPDNQHHLRTCSALHRSSWSMRTVKTITLASKHWRVLLPTD